MAKVLLVYPESPSTFWSFDEAVKMIGKKASFPPLGLLTIAGMLPAAHDLRLIDMNVGPLEDEDLAWADIVLTSSMIIHWHSLEDVIARCNQAGVPVLNGGPLATQYHEEIEGEGVFYLGEAENGFLDVMDRMLADPGSVKREVIDTRGQFGELAETPIPRWDLIDFGAYASVVMQITRGCPESCTFCNIPALYGKVTRVKAQSHIIREFDALYDAGWRGTIMAVDDNFVGNREAIRKALEEEVIPWQEERGYPFQLHTQASIRVSDDPALMEAMYRAGFDKVFAGIESPVEESLKFMGAQKNMQGDTPLLDKIRILQKKGFEVQAGFIMGLDTDPDDIAERMVSFIQEAGITVAMVGILGVLRDTPDYKRFARAGRLVEGIKYTGDSGIFNRELSFVPLIDPDELFERHRTTLETINSPRNLFKRCLTFLDHRGRRPICGTPVTMAQIGGFLRSIWRQGITGGYRWEYWKFLARVVLEHPLSFSDAGRMAIQGRHLILTTQQALQVDEMKTFFSEAVEHLERYCQGRREAFQKNVGTYASLLTEAVEHRLEHYRPDRVALQHYAAVLLGTAREHYASLRDEFRHQVRGPLEQFQEEIQRIVQTYAGEEISLQRVVL